jgi:alpha-L-rhamnosidase
MKIYKLRTNQIENPLGYELNRLSLSWITECTNSNYQEAAKVEVALDEVFENIIFDSGKDDGINSLAFCPDIQLKPRTRYYWRVTVWGDKGDVSTSEPAWFETAKMDEAWQGKWIKPDLENDVHPLIRKTVTIPEDVVSARAYFCGLGIYDVVINGKKVGEEFFAPGYHAYDFWLQYQTYDITDFLTTGENAVGLLLGNGWYKGRFGFGGGFHNLYGDEFSVIGEIVLTHQDGSTTVIGTNNEWKSAPSPVMFSGIYDGEIYNANKEISNWSTPSFDDSDWNGVIDAKDKSERLQARINLPIKIMEERKPVVIHTPKEEIVLDFGQNMAGWVRFKTSAKKGQELKLQYGEILQDDCFYRDNLRTAKAEYVYISDGTKREVQPHFTFYGFRYVKLTGFEGEINPDDYTACVIYSELEETGMIETSNPLVNRLFLNALWGQKGNFLDVPTDCPQRDERMGWTGDAQIFTGTACFNMYSPAFYNKYLRDLREEQLRIGGSVPFHAPTIKPKGEELGFVAGNGSSIWGDAATIIPWTLYVHYGDKQLLSEHFASMKDWVDYIKRKDDETGGHRLWRTGFHFGDWLALDGKDPSGKTGGTDAFYVASAYYTYSARIVAKAGRVLGKLEIANEYDKLADEVKEAIMHEYFTSSGRIAIHTQTAMIVALYMDLVPENYRERLIHDLKEKLREDNMHLTTGFVGTPYFTQVLSNNGANDFAYKLLLNDDYPSWLYAVKMGATTIWERWNSVLPDGKISGTDMNSLNHYAYGSIAEWMYKSMCGINPVEGAPGFKKTKLTPKPYGKLSFAKAKFNSASGLIESGWELGEDGNLTFMVTIPFDTTAELVLPDADLSTVQVKGQQLVNSEIDAKQEGSNVCCELVSGSYRFTYQPTKKYLLTYNSGNTICELLENLETKEIFAEEFPELINNPMLLEYNSENTVQELKHSPFTSSVVTEERVAKLDERLDQVRVK